jgi:hypothetical protein
VSVGLTDGRQLRRVTTTDAEGRYEFLELPAGRFSVSVTKAGYVPLQYGQRRPFEAGTPVNVADGETVERIDFSLPRGSVIAAASRTSSVSRLPAPSCRCSDTNTVRTASGVCDRLAAA